MYMTKTSDLDALEGRLSGSVVAPGEDRYDASRQAWNLAVDQRPAAVVYPESADDVATAVRFAAEQDLRVAPQTTGHNANPMGGLESALLLRTERMRGVEIDADARRARAQGGAQWVDVTAPASERGLAALAGSAPDVGVVGYHVGGGMSLGLGRKHGLAANHVTEIEVVTAEGEILRANRESESDLFWAIRGGGGNFGVVTAIEFGLFELPSVYAGMLAWPLEAAPEVLRVWRDWSATVPDEVTTSLRLMRLPDMPDMPDPFRGRSLIVIDGAFAGDEAGGAAQMAALRELGPEIDTFMDMPPVALSYIHMDPPEPVPAMSDHQMLGSLPDAAVERVLELAGPGVDSALLMVELRHLGGALGRAPADAGALGAFRGEFAMFNAGIPADPEVARGLEAELGGLREAMSPFDAEVPYLNFAENPADVASAYTEASARRLAEVKAAYDPDGRFQANHEIDPA
jgi:FAD binding domain